MQTPLEPLDAVAEMTQSGLNLIQQALSIYDKNLKLVTCNRRFAELFELPQRLVQSGADFAETIRYLANRGEYGSLDDMERFIEERVSVAREFSAHYFERTRADGRTISVEGSPLRQGGWVTVYTDITEVKRNEQLLRAKSDQLHDELLSQAEVLARSNRELRASNQALAAAQHALIEAEARTRTTTEMMPAHIAYLNHQRIYTYSNRRLNKVILGAPETIEGMHARDALGEEAYAAISPYFDRAFQGEECVFEFEHSNGQRTIRCALTPQSSAEKVSGIYILSMDVTEETRSRTILMQNRKRRLAAQLTRGLAHDFSNLLTIIMGLQSDLERRSDLSVDALELVRTTKAAALRGGALLDRISGISNPRELMPTAVSLERFLRELYVLARPTVRPAIKLEMNLLTELEPVLLDVGYLQDSLLNMLLNANDAIGDREGLIRVSIQARDIWLELIVEDTGHGFDEHAIKYATTPFYTTKNAAEGAGLGLAMVYDFAHLSGGDLHLANRADGGAVITLRLPLIFASNEAVAPLLLLLVDDDPALREGIRNQLTEAQHTVVEASNLDEAERLFHAVSPDVLLSDIDLNGEVGLALYERLGEDLQRCQVIFMTGLPSDDPRFVAASERAKVLRKPFLLEQLQRDLVRP